MRVRVRVNPNPNRYLRRVVDERVDAWEAQQQRLAIQGRYRGDVGEM